VAGLGLKVPIFNGTRSKYNLSQAKSAISMTGFETDLAKKTITSDVTENNENVKASMKKIERFKLQLSQSEEAFQLAQTSYQAGSITNLDLLDATTAISESSLLLLKSKIEYITNIFKLKASIGERLY
jgi:outer membrane protein TolC